jgi:hypothetical protein
MSQYLYGASVQGIQQFIFSTNKLREISGASEIVEYICTEFLEKQLNHSGGYDKSKLLVGAAGNIKYLFDRHEDCERFVYDFPRLVMGMAPGVTISQACLRLENGIQKDSLQKLEDLLKSQRNKLVAQHGSGWMVSERSRRTGAPAAHSTAEGRVSEAQFLKSEYAGKGGHRLLSKMLDKAKIPKDIHRYEMEDLLGGQERGWIAVIHADGNNLGQKIIKLASAVSEDKMQGAFREMSERLENATIRAAKEAFQTLSWKEGSKLPMRPVVLGGDDLTVIMDGRYAIAFTQCFLRAFEEATKEEFSDYKKKFGVDVFENGFTACAGIAFVKPKYPFHYAVKLSEKLCERAKKVSKLSADAPSCLLFHKVHSSFVDDYDDIVKRELTANKVQFDFGPYFLRERNTPDNYTTITQLLKWVRSVQERNAPAAPLREWLNDLKVSRGRADQAMTRIQSLNKEYLSTLGLDEWEHKRTSESSSHTHLYDVIQLANISKI